MKVYCQLCCYCYDPGYTGKSYCRCRHPRHLVDNFYGRSWDDTYCDHKNRNNNCSDFKLLPSVERKMKRKERLKAFRTKLGNLLLIIIEKCKIKR